MTARRADPGRERAGQKKRGPKPAHLRPAGRRSVRRPAILCFRCLQPRRELAKMPKAPFTKTARNSGGRTQVPLARSEGAGVCRAPALTGWLSQCRHSPSGSWCRPAAAPQQTRSAVWSGRYRSSPTGLLMKPVWPGAEINVSVKCTLRTPVAGLKIKAAEIKEPVAKVTSFAVPAGLEKARPASVELSVPLSYPTSAFKARSRKENVKAPAIGCPKPMSSR